MASFYDENPDAFAVAARRKAFQDSLLDGTGLADILASDPDLDGNGTESRGQRRVRDELKLLVERAWNAQERALADLDAMRRGAPLEAMPPC